MSVDTLPTAFQLASCYDRLRLSVYRERGRRGDSITIATVGESHVLRFDDVGYFNLIYAGPDIRHCMGAVENRFIGSPHGCRLLWPGLRDEGSLADLCWTRGWQPDEELAWLSGPCLEPNVASHAVDVRRARPDEAALFFQTYLCAFEANPDRVAPAVDNMRHLFDEPSLHFLFATRHGEPAGIGMLMHRGSDALLCAGAMVPAHRGFGGHEALLAARLALARDLGCANIHSWARRGSRSARHMEQLGLRTTAVSRTWRFRPGRGR